MTLALNADRLSCPPAGMAAYEQRLNSEPRWAMMEGSRFFDEKNAVHDTLRRIVHRLNELGIPYAVVGGLSLFAHGFHRFTEDVGLLVTAEGLTRIHKELDGLGYIPPFAGSKNLRDTESGVKIEFLVTGQFPGDGKPKPIAFPEPSSVAIEKDGIKYIRLASLIELKLASGMTSPQRLKDLSDVMELVKLLHLPEDFCRQLAPFVQQKYMEIWQSATPVARRYMLLWRSKLLTADVRTIDDMIARFPGDADTLKAMQGDGITLDPDRGTTDGKAYLVTSNPAVATKYDMHEEAEFWGSGM